MSESLRHFKEEDGSQAVGANSHDKGVAVRRMQIILGSSPRGTIQVKGERGASAMGINRGDAESRQRGAPSRSQEASSEGRGRQGRIKTRKDQNRSPRKVGKLVGGNGTYNCMAFIAGTGIILPMDGRALKGREDKSMPFEISHGRGSGSDNDNVVKDRNGRSAQR